MISHSTDIRVRYADTDAMTFVYHGNYLIYFEQARSEMLRAAGLSYAEIERMGLFIVVIEAHIHYHQPARYDDVLHVKAAMNERPSSRLRIDYEISKDGADQLLITGYTVHTFINKSTQKPVRPPKEFMEMIQKYY